jgi:endonuclease/exonuclease/phosphatase family metal-dependent hydrolase
VVDASGPPVVLMGDFNVPPGDRGWTGSTPRRTHGGSGQFDEVDQGPDKCRCGAVTQRSGEKIDYVFVTAGDFDIVKSQATHAAYSDHASLRGWVDKK